MLISGIVHRAEFLTYSVNPRQASGPAQRNNSRRLERHTEDLQRKGGQPAGILLKKLSRMTAKVVTSSRSLRSWMMLATAFCRRQRLLSMYLRA